MLQIQHLASSISGALTTAAATVGMTSPDVVDSSDNSYNRTDASSNKKHNGNSHHRHNKHRRNRKKKKKKKKLSGKSSFSQSASSPPKTDDDDVDLGSDTSSIDEDDEGLAKILPETIRSSLLQNKKKKDSNLMKMKTNHHLGYGTAPIPTTTTTSKVTPQEQLRQFFISKHGLSAKEIDDATEKMWDKNLAYDNPQAVLDYINGGRRHSTSTDSEGPFSSSSSKQSLSAISSACSSTVEEQEQSITSVTCQSSLFLGEGEDQSEQTTENYADDENPTAKDDLLTSMCFDNNNNEEERELDFTSSAPTGMSSFDSEGDLATTAMVELTFDNETIQTPPRSSSPCTNKNHQEHLPSQIGHQHQHQHRKEDNETGAPQGNRHETTTKNGLGSSITTTDAVVDDDHESSPRHSPTHVQSGRLDIAEKLDIVADFDNLPDAIFALTEWINKAAKPNELEALCKAQMTTALPTVLRRGIVESTDQMKDDTVVLSSLLRMLSSLLCRCDIDYDAVEEIEANLEDVLFEARDVYTALSNDKNIKNDDERDRISERVVEFVTILMSNVVSESQVTPIVECPSKETDPVSTLIWKREMQKIEAKRACASARFSLNAVLCTCGDGDDYSSTWTNHRHMPIDFDLSHDDAVVTLVGEETKTSIDMQKTILEEFQNQTHEDVDGIDTSVQELNDSLSTLVSEQATVRDKMAKLKAALAVLEGQDEILSQRIGGLKGNMVKERLTKGARTITMNEQLEHANATVQYGESIDRLVETMMTYNRSMKKILKKSKSEEPTDPSVSMTLCLQHSRNYFLSEAECVEELQQRVQTNKSKLSKLEVELARWNDATQQNSIDMEEDISLLQKKIDTDSRRAASFREEASKMFEDLMNQLENYQKSASADAIRMEPIQTDLLNGISLALETLGVPGSRLETFFLITQYPHKSQDRTNKSVDCVPLRSASSSDHQRSVDKQM